MSDNKKYRAEWQQPVSENVPGGKWLFKMDTPAITVNTDEFIKNNTEIIADIPFYMFEDDGHRSCTPHKLMNLLKPLLFVVCLAGWIWRKR